MKNNKTIHQYNGYSVTASAHPLPDGWFAANLLLVRDDQAGPAQYQFDALEYFNTAKQAVRHAARWARHWVDTRG